MAYIDGFLLPLPKKNIEAYRRVSKIAGKQAGPKEMPFDMEKMAYGGFSVLVDR